ncbi:MAG: UDP-N-acetylmuramate dehydrogenase [Candidatus Caenarcaniphilales bacterium]|nr:UDP-N-acetylmuramate dehydrogenase [Candidatus Caenarcaniphilales bacterium]
MYQTENTSLCKLTTMRVGGFADMLFVPHTPEEFVSLVVQLTEEGIPWSVLGGGSNTLVSSKGVRGAVISTAGLDWITRSSRDSIIAGAGTRLPKLAGQVAQMGLSGCEFLEGIPGTVGGAVVMNAGAHGHATANILEKVTVFDLVRMEIEVLTGSQLEFGYRCSNLHPSRYLVLEAKFRLNDGMPDQILDRMKQYSRQRAASQPKGFSSGCIFRNPPCSLTPAGRLIDELGMKGYRLGGAEVSVIHANFILNSQGASSDQIIALILKIQQKVWAVRRIWLQPEVWPLGEFSQEENLIWLRPEEREDLEIIEGNEAAA